MKTERIERLLRLVQTLESGRSLSVEQLTKILGVTRRTIFRDLKVLDHAGLPYSFDRDTGRYTAQQSVLLPPVTLSQSEALALVLAARHLIDNPAFPDANAAAAASAKLESVLPAAIQDYLEPLLRRMEVLPEPTSSREPIADAMKGVQDALAGKFKLEVRYDSYFEKNTIDVVLHPYRLIHLRRGWYLLAHTEGVEEVRTYKLERMLRLRVLNTPYTIDPGFSLDRYFGNAWIMMREDKSYHVKIRFLKQVAANVDEVHWHKTQVTSYDADGSLIFEVDVDGIKEISWWILGYGDQAQVLEPPELREMIAESTQRMYAHYNPKPDGD